MDFESFVNDITQNAWNVFGTEVYEDGILTHSYGDTVSDIHEIYSATKTVLSIAAGLASDEGRFDISKPLLHYLPKGSIDKIPDEQKSIFGSLSVERFLTMSVTDLPFRAEGDSFLDYSLNVKIEETKKKEFNISL